MSKVFFTVNKLLIIFFILFGISASAAMAAEDVKRPEEKPIIITSQMLTADNKNNIVTFEGSVVAKSEDLTIYSDKMEVFYNNSLKQITKIYAHGNVKAIKNDYAIFSNEATYSGPEEKIVFTGKPKAVDGENVITGTEIVYFLKENRTVVKGSRVILKKQTGIKNALPSN